ncbi:hypothetical protein [Streptococcus oricebi]|uniref:Lipoprotein n=1 Tax=Streptococcus oricebi TaxID=1547447 RepID=A0ABS5B112_9STRE|nr:hypothetical protein [Streptococcus oricebi]MBP2622356.1 hypothetical protein [Streptococcus oricebi]
MKKKWFLGLAFLASLIMVSACNHQSPSKETSQTSSSSSSSVNDSSSDLSQLTKDTQRIGSDDYGYVNIPKDWVTFHDVNGGDDIQYSDGTDINIISLNTITAEKAGVKDLSEISAEEMANRFYVGWESKKEVTKQIAGSRTTIAGNVAYKITILTQQGKIMLIWVLGTPDKKIYYISLEGTKAALVHVLPLIEQTWSTSK